MPRKKNKPEKPYKVGRFKKEEETWIRQNASLLSPSEIAQKLGRSERQVLAFLIKEPYEPKKPEKNSTTNLRYGLKDSALWQTIKDELEAKELVYFEEQYILLMEQFKSEEVLPTEENQIFKVIKLDILKHRNAVHQKRTMRELDLCQRAKDDLTKSEKCKELDSKTISNIEKLDQKIINLYAQQTSFSREYVILEDKHQKLMEALKATREQRVDKIESGKQDFIGLIRSLTDDKIRDEHERYIELMRRATSKEQDRLSKPHQYLDGEFDQPILNGDTVNTDAI